jgi:hypothetical protein
LKELDPQIKQNALRDKAIAPILVKYDKCADIIDLALFLNDRCKEKEDPDLKKQLVAFSELQKLAHKEHLDEKELNQGLKAQISKISSMFGSKFT